MKLLLDTCVLIDYFGCREPFFEACSSLRIAEWHGEFELWASAKSFTDVFYCSTCSLAMSRRRTSNGRFSPRHRFCISHR